MVMSMKRFIEGENRYQSTLFPERLDDYIAEDNAVRVVDAFVERLDLLRLGFEGIIPESTGRPGYHPAMMLKLYIYGYLNRIQSSRRLEREAQRNVELIWLTGRLMPAFKTIADFRKGNREAICTVCFEFIELCRELQLFSGVLVAIDGSKFKAVNSRDNNYTVKSVKRRIKKTQENIERYLAKLDDVDAEEPEIREVTAKELKKKIASMEAKMDELKAKQQEVAEHPDKQVSSTDPDCRSMTKPGGGSVVGYNVQSAVDEKHHLIVTHEVTNDTTDRAQLDKMGKQAKRVLDASTLTVVADAGYYEGQAIVNCYEDGIQALVPKVDTSSSKSKGKYSKADFKYDAARNEYVCPAGERLTYRFDSVEKGKRLWVYERYGCSSCKLRPQCTTATEKRLKRWEHEAVLDKAQANLKEHPEAMRQRKALAEHPFSTIKQLMGSTHFLMRRLPNVKAEMSLNVLAYNMKRAINVLGTDKIIAAMQSA
jgi:transposase